MSIWEKIDINAFEWTVFFNLLYQLPCFFFSLTAVLKPEKNRKDFFKDTSVFDSNFERLEQIAIAIEFFWPSHSLFFGKRVSIFLYLPSIGTLLSTGKFYANQFDFVACIRFLIHRKCLKMLSVLKDFDFRNLYPFKFIGQNSSNEILIYILRLKASKPIFCRQTDDTWKSPREARVK